MVADRRSVLAGMGGLALGACSGGPSPAPGVAPPPPLGERALNFTRLEARHGGRIGVVAQDGGARVAWRGDERFNYCSTFKLFLAAAVLERVQRGEERLDRAIPITAADMVSHAPATQPAVGQALTIQQLCQATVELSDNPAANILIRELGGLDAWRGWHRSIPDATTTVDRWETELNVPDGDRDTTTANQTVSNLAAVLNTGRLDAAHAALLNGWLVASPTGPNRIKAGAPPTWTVGHKTGTWIGNGLAQVNDIGVVRPHTGSPIFIAVYYAATDASSVEQRDAVIADATLVALAALNHG